MKIWIVSARYGTEMITPAVYKDQATAEHYAREYIHDAAMNDYDGDITHPTFDQLEEWSTDRGYVMNEFYYWNGGNDATEAMITEVTI